MLPTQRMWFSFAPTREPPVLFATNLWIRNCIIAMAADTEVVLIADTQLWPDVLQISFNHTVGSKYLLNKKYLPSLVSLMDKQNMLGWTLSLTLMVQSRIWTSLSLLPSLAIRPWCLLPAQNLALWPRERRRSSLIGIHTSILSRSFLRQLADPVHMPRSSLIICCEMLITHQLLSETPGPPSRAFSTVPSPNNNLWQPLRDPRSLLSHPAASYILFFACVFRPPGFAHSLILSQARCSGAMWPCCDFTSSDDDEHNTDSSFLLLFVDIGITPTLLDGLTDVDVLHIALGCRFVLDILTVSQHYSSALELEPLPLDSELLLF